MFSETFLIYSVGVLIHKERSKMMLKTAPDLVTRLLSPVLSPRLMTPVSRFLTPLSASVWSLGGQSILAAWGWNSTTSQLHSLLDKVNINDLPVGWQNLNPLSHPNATLAPQARQAKASGKNLNYVTLAPKVSFELLAESLF